MTDTVPLDILQDIPIRDTSGRFSLVADQATLTGAGTATEAARVTELVQKITATGAVTMGDEVMERRLRNLVAVFIKGVRNELQTREALQRARANGGLGLDDRITDLVMQLLRTRPAPKPVPSAPPGTVPATSRPAKPTAAPHQFTVDELEHELPPPPPAMMTRSQPLPKPIATASVQATLRTALHITKQAVMPPPQGSTVKPFADRPVPLPTRAVTKAAWWQQLTGRWRRQPKPSVPVAAPGVTAAVTHERITDVRPPSRLVSPVEELRRLRLVDWRALGNPQQAIDRIWDKIQLIAAASFPQAHAARAAWRDSEVHRLYLAMGKEAVEQRRSLDASIAARQQARQPVLTSGEYAALAKLSRMLEY